MKILLVGNYKQDGSTSMEIYSSMLRDEFTKIGHEVIYVEPAALMSSMSRGSKLAQKWLGYFDKFVIFPWILAVKAKGVDLVHICDHGYSMYAFLPIKSPILITCHDVIAIRGSLGEKVDCKSSRLGVYLQEMVVAGLRHAEYVVCASYATCTGLKRILPYRSDKFNVIQNGLNHEYKKIQPREEEAKTNTSSSYILNVSSSLPRKNRISVLRIFNQVKQVKDVQLVLAGEKLSEEEATLMQSLNIDEGVRVVESPSTENLEKLYNAASLLLFPSKQEGFGWPIIEAQSCGCPVVASTIEPFIEIASGSSILISVEDEPGMAKAVVDVIENDALRDSLISNGLDNVQRHFTKERMVGEYLELYKRIVCN